MCQRIVVELFSKQAFTNVLLSILKTSLSQPCCSRFFNLFSTPVVIISERANYFSNEAFGYGDNITTFAVPKKWVIDYWNKLEIKRYVCQRFNSL